MSLIFKAVALCKPVAIGRSLHTSPSVHSDGIKKFLFQASHYRKLGLLRDDFFDPDDGPVVEEAIRRLPEELQMARTYRCIKAHQLAISHSILPKEEWTKFENDETYLKPYLEEVAKEFKEMKEWEANH